ncbi:transport protein TonB [Serratia quinivorans]|uniref:TonB family protein n=1 Tax=Serratia quinivorans TaxID=137545 RepID=UPI0021776749|nr:TonB family protein [Serratia quinivorans]CAI1732715.1 transport protein TonB [Serratia quinivorans]
MLIKLAIKGWCGVLFGLLALQVQAATPTGCEIDSHGQTPRHLSASAGGNVADGGYIVLCYDIDRGGKVQNLRVIEEHPEAAFDREILAAVSQWRFASSKPIKDQRMTVRFKPAANP